MKSYYYLLSFTTTNFLLLHMLIVYVVFDLYYLIIDYLVLELYLINKLILNNSYLTMIGNPYSHFILRESLRSLS